LAAYVIAIGSAAGKIPASRSGSIHQAINFVSNPVGCQQSCEKGSCQPENGRKRRQRFVRDERNKGMSTT
jgi:hypothetical protein